tara:strand:- start:7366 stop:7989 length:624 start_codon:yes stop_codon:yes gene_type:complete
MIDSTREIRSATVAELRAGGGELPVLEGYAAVFDEPSQPIGGFFVEHIEPGAFSRALTTAPDVRALVDHDPSRILGRTTSGTLSLKEDRHGLLATIQPPDTSTGRDIVESVRRGDVSQMSFAFGVAEGGQRWESREDGDHRFLSDLDLFDVSVVTYPAYESTEVSTRTLEEWNTHQGHRMNAQVREVLAGQKKHLDRFGYNDPARRL